MGDEVDGSVLDGGLLSTVVREGGTVRRSTGPWTPAVHALLRHLESVGFDGAPQVHGIDEEGREIVSFIPGRVIGSERPWPAWVWSDEVLQATGHWLGEYHRAVADFKEPVDAKWRMNWSPQGEDEIICHFDVAPYNLVLMDDDSVTFIDWDVAAPGPALLELAKVANSFSPVHDAATREALDFEEGKLNPAMLERIVERTGMLLDSYGLEDHSGFVDMMLEASMHSWQRIHRGADEGDVPLQNLVASGAIGHLMTTRTMFVEHRDALIKGIE